MVANHARHTLMSRLSAKAARVQGTSVDRSSKTKSISSTTAFGKRGILSDDNGDGYDDVTGEYAYQSMGYFELLTVVDQMQMKKQDVAMNFLMADAIYDDVVAFCADQNDSTDDGCDIPAGSISMTFTVEMMNFILEAAGIKTDDPYYSDYTAMYQEMIGTELPVPALTYTTLDGSAGYDRQLVMDNGSWEDYTSTTTLRWDAARTKVALLYDYGSDSWGQGSDSYTYNDSEKKVVYRNSSSYSGSSWTYSMTMQEDSAHTDTHGVLFTERSDYQDASSQYVMDISGIADDNGGYVESKYSTTYTEFQVSGGYEFLDPNQYYYIVADENCPLTVDWNMIIGSVYTWDNYTYDEDWNITSTGDGVVSSDEAYAYLWGGSGLPSTYSVCKYSYSYDDATYQYTESLEDLGGTVTIGTGTTYTYIYQYQEGFDAQGYLTYAAYANCYDNGTCDPYDYYFGASTAATDDYSTSYEDASSDGSLIATTTYVVHETSPGALAALDPSSTYIVFTSSGSGQPDDYWSNVVGYSYYDSWSNCEYDVDGNYVCGDGSWATYYWGTDEEASSAEAYIYTYDPDTYVWSYTSTTDFSLVAQ